MSEAQKPSLVIDLWTEGFAHALAQLARFGQRIHAQELIAREGYDLEKFVTAGVKAEDIKAIWPQYKEAA
jgi:hypothetical protein